MSIPIISADERLKEKKGIKICIFGKHGSGKTYQLNFLPEDKTLFIDLEAGDTSVSSWKGDAIRPRTWEECRNLAVIIGGKNKINSDSEPYGQIHYEREKNIYKDTFDKYDFIFIDSISYASRYCFKFAKKQSISKKTGEIDTRNAYGILAQEMMSWLMHLQHAYDKDIIFVGALDEKKDETGISYFEPQIEGTKIGLELPGIVDQVITIADLKKEDKYIKKFICKPNNPQGYPAKDRSGKLSMLEEPNIMKIIEKIKHK